MVEHREAGNKWVTSGIRVSSTRLRFLNKLMKEENISDEFKKYYYQYKKIYNRVISEAKKLSNSILWEPPTVQQALSNRSSNT
jgi:hypothetical protein